MNERKYNESVSVSVIEWIDNNLDQRLSVDDMPRKRVIPNGIYRNYFPVSESLPPALMI